MNENEKTWDTIAESFDKTRRKVWSECTEFINHLDHQENSLDLACGNGRHLFPLAKKTKSAIGIDISKNLLKIIQNKIQQKNIKNISLFHANAKDIPLKKNTIDTVIYIAALHNIKFKKNRIKSLKEVRRILKKDGSALISVWSREQDRFRNYPFEKNIKNKEKTEYGDITIFWRQDKHDIPRFYHLYSKQEFIEDIEKSGLDILEISESKIVSKNYPDNFFAHVR